MNTDSKPTPVVTGAPGADAESCPEHRQARMAGLWAAELLGLIGQAAHDYARDLVRANPAGSGGAPLFRRLSQDLRGKIGAHDLREKLGHFLREARQHHPGDGGRPK